MTDTAPSVDIKAKKKITRQEAKDATLLQSVSRILKVKRTRKVINRHFRLG